MIDDRPFLRDPITLIIRRLTGQSIHIVIDHHTSLGSTHIYIAHHPCTVPNHTSYPGKNDIKQETKKKPNESPSGIQEKSDVW
jgi:hypothetical protein